MLQSILTAVEWMHDNTAYLKRLTGLFDRALGKKPMSYRNLRRTRFLRMENFLMGSLYIAAPVLPCYADIDHIDNMSQLVTKMKEWYDKVHYPWYGPMDLL
jgi:hypothetical protein